MLRHPAWIAIFVLSLAGALTLGVERHRLRTEREHTASIVLAAGNLAAERDSTRRVAARLGDSLQVVRRLVVQVMQGRDALDRALGGERRARYALAVSVDSLKASALAPPAGDSGGGGPRRLGFAFRQPPYSVTADVEIPEPPDTARMGLSVALDSIPLVVRVMCSPPGEHGVRAATVAATSPPWAAIRLGHLEQSPELCQAPAAAAARQSPRVSFGRVIVGLGLVGRSPRAAALGWFIGAGLVIRG